MKSWTLVSKFVSLLLVALLGSGCADDGDISFLDGGTPGLDGGTPRLDAASEGSEDSSVTDPNGHEAGTDGGDDDRDAGPDEPVDLADFDPDAMFDSFNDAYLVRSGDQTFYKKSVSAGSAPDDADYFWEQALDIQVAEDVFVRTRSSAHRDLIAALLDTFVDMNGTDWTWNDFNDDLAWAGLAFVRGHEITGNADYLARAKYAFDLAYDRGWTDDFGGGIWWSTNPADGKEALSNNPNGILACYLHRFLENDTYYLDRAKEIYAWIHDTIYDPETGAVYQWIKEEGVSDEVSTFNVGTFVELANDLYHLTGQRSYYDDAVKAVEYVQTRKSVDGIILPGSSEFARGLGKFVRENGLWSAYYDWMRRSAEGAWAVRRPDNGLSWGRNWIEPTPDEDFKPLDVISSVVMVQVTPRSAPR